MADVPKSHLDYFAAHAMAALVGSERGRHMTFETIALTAYNLAEAVMAERNRRRLAGIEAGGPLDERPQKPPAL
jgi:hypothetical protein